MMETKGTAASSGESLRRSIHNQLVHQLATSSHPEVTLELRNTDLLSFWPAVLQYCRPYKTFLCMLDLSYCRLNEDTIFELCQVSEASLRTLRLAACHISDLHPNFVWPKRLEELDLSRNELTRFPPRLMSLQHLRTLNLSGNRISEFDKDVLSLPYLSKLQLVRNPIVNVPASVRLGHVTDMRVYFGIDRPGVELDADTVTCHRDPSRVSCDHQARQHSESESGHDSDAISRRSASEVWPPYEPSAIPIGYAPFATRSDCSLCFPTNHFPPASLTCAIDIVNDVSLYPPRKPREILITPVVRVTPHGLTFPPSSPAVLSLPHCLSNDSCLDAYLMPMCSNTGPHQVTSWEPLPLLAQRLHNHIIVPTTHFSMFAVLLLPLPYPTAQAIISPEEGGTLHTPELPGFVVQFPPCALTSATMVQATVYYADEPYHTLREEEVAPLASTCLGLEPHGVVFCHPVKVSLPVLGSHYVVGAQLKVWCAPFNPERTDVLEWAELSSIVNVSPDGLVATFELKHFSFFKLMWTYCRDTVVRIRDGAMFVYKGLRNIDVNMSCQVLLSPPLPDQTCGMILVGYKFGKPLPVMSNYPLKVGESPSVRLTVGTIQVAIQGQITIQAKCNDTLVKTITFSGDDFSVQFLLQLTCELESYSPFGMIQLSSITASSGVSPQQINLVAVSVILPTVLIL